MNDKSYIGTKRIDAMPMNRGEYNKKLGVEIPENDAYYAEEGYPVKYPDGYVSWSPKKQFEDVYRTSGTMNFGHALELLKLGCKVARKGWNGKNMFLFLEKGEFLTHCIHNEIIQDSKNMCQNFDICPYSDSICMKTAQGTIVVGWLASQTDMLAEDWEIVDN